jgi:hypothetical protein
MPSTRKGVGEGERLFSRSNRTGNNRMLAPALPELLDSLAYGRNRDEEDNVLPAESTVQRDGMVPLTTFYELRRAMMLGLNALKQTRE